MNARSRYRFCTIERDPADRLYHGPRPHFGYRDLPDTMLYVTHDGDTLGHIAARFYARLPRASTLFWIIADFQPEPIRDPFVRIVAGRTLYIPSPLTVQTQILVSGRTVSDEVLA